MSLIYISKKMKKLNVVFISIFVLLCLYSCENGAKKSQLDNAKVQFYNEESWKFSPAKIRRLVERYHLPNNTVVADEDENAVLLMSVNGRDSVSGDHIITLWKYYKQQRDIQEVVTSHPLADLTWYTPNDKHGISIGMDSVFTIKEAMLQPVFDSLIVVNGTLGEIGPIYSFIIDADTKKAILLPSNRGCIGFTSEEGLPICQSCRRYGIREFDECSVVSVYDWNGKLVKEMSLEGYEE